MLALLGVSLVYVLLRRFSVSWVWMIPVGALVLQLGMTLIYPRLILPIFYKIEPIDDPALMVDGGDPQLDAAIELMLAEIEANPYTPPTRPTAPDRSGMGVTEEDK